MSNYRLDDLATFIDVVESGSITAAARLLGVPKSTVSRRVTRLEDALGVTLVQRGGRRATVTVDGALLHRRAVGPLREIGLLERLLADRGEVPTGRLRITAAHDLGSTARFGELIARFQARWPQVVPEVLLANRHMDLLEEGIDVAIRAHQDGLPDTGALRMRSLGKGPICWFASPEYVERRGTPSTLEELGEHDLIFHTLLLRERTWCHTDGRRAELDLSPAMICNDFGVVRAVTGAGGGIGAMPTFLAPDRDVIPLLPNWAIRSGHLSILWPAVRHTAPRVRAFIDVCVEVLGAGPGLNP